MNLWKKKLTEKNQLMKKWKRLKQKPMKRTNYYRLNNKKLLIKSKKQ